MFYFLKVCIFTQESYHRFFHPKSLLVFQSPFYSMAFYPSLTTALSPFLSSGCEKHFRFLFRFPCDLFIRWLFSHPPDVCLFPVDFGFLQCFAVLGCVVIIILGKFSSLPPGTLMHCRGSQAWVLLTSEFGSHAPCGTEDSPYPFVAPVLPWAEGIAQTPGLGRA